MLHCPFRAFQGFQAIAGRRVQKRQCLCRVKLCQLANRDVRNARKLLAFSSLKQCLRVGATKAPNHGDQGITSNVIRQVMRIELMRPDFYAYRRFSTTT